MSDKKLTSLTKMKRSQIGIVRELHGGENFVKKLSDLGIRPGKHIQKVSSMVLSGPTVISIDKRHIAVGFGMAKRIFVEIK